MKQLDDDKGIIAGVAGVVLNDHTGFTLHKSGRLI